MELWTILNDESHLDSVSLAFAFDSLDVLALTHGG